MSEERLFMTFQLPNGTQWTTSVTSETRVTHVISLLSSHWGIPADTISIWERSFNLSPQAKLALRIHPKTKQSPLLSVQVDTSPRNSAQSGNSDSVDLESINTSEQERIFHQIMQARVDENLRQAQEMNGTHRIGQQTRCVICKVRGKTLRMIVDTGASVSILYMNQVEMCSVGYLVDEREECQIRLVGVGNTEHRAVGVIHSLEVMIGEVKTFGTFAVLDKPGITGLLGIDWLRQNGAVIKTVDDTLEIDGNVIQFEDAML